MCVISLGVVGPRPPDHPIPAVKNFGRGLERIRQDLVATGCPADFLAWENQYPAGSPTILNAPFAFKPFCFHEARLRGYDIILWLDSSIKIKRSPAPLFDRIQEDGYLMFKECHSVGEYCKDEALGPLEITRAEAFLMPSCRASVLGLNLTRNRSLEFLRCWKALASDGITFPGPKWSGVRGWPQTASADPRVKGHRHDQTAASVVARRLGMDDWKSMDLFDRYFENQRRFVRAGSNSAAR